MVYVGKIVKITPTKIKNKMKCEIHINLKINKTKTNPIHYLKNSDKLDFRELEVTVSSGRQFQSAIVFGKYEYLTYAY